MGQSNQEGRATSHPMDSKGPSACLHPGPSRSSVAPYLPAPAGVTVYMVDLRSMDRGCSLAPYVYENDEARAHCCVRACLRIGLP